MSRDESTNFKELEDEPAAAAGPAAADAPDPAATEAEDANCCSRHTREGLWVRWHRTLVRLHCGGGRPTPPRFQELSARKRDIYLGGL